MKTETPRVNALLEKLLASRGEVWEGNAPEAWVKLARELERDLNAANKALDDLHIVCVPSAISRPEAARREVTCRALSEHPEMMPETVARHYTSLATTAMQLRECIAARKAGANGMDEAIAHCTERLRQCYINDFGAEPHWHNGAFSDAGGSSEL